MENKPAQQNIQDSFLNNARRDKSAITIYLLSGVKLTGRIRSFDKYSVVLDTNNNQEQLIFKHAISTVVTSKAAQASHVGYSERTMERPTAQPPSTSAPAVLSSVTPATASSSPSSSSANAASSAPASSAASAAEKSNEE